MKRGWWLIIIILAIIIIGVGAYFLFFYEKICTDNACFNSEMSSCKKATYTSESTEASWQYTIKGIKNNSCIINVELLQAKTGSVDVEKIEGLDMICILPLGYTGDPQADLSLCSGKLKEGMQDLIINKMHAYILSNIGKISEELSKVV